MPYPLMFRDLNTEAYLWYTITSPEFVDQSLVGLKKFIAFQDELTEKHTIGQRFGPALYLSRVLAELLDTYPNARALLVQGEFEAMLEWGTKLGDIGRELTESARWMDMDEFLRLREIHNETFRPVAAFNAATEITRVFSDIDFTGGQRHWSEIPEDMSYRGANILRKLQTSPELFNTLETVPEYHPDTSVTCHTGLIVPCTGVWVPAGGMGTTALAFARQGQVMQPMYPVTHVDENRYEYTQAVETDWYLLRPTGRKVPLASAEAPVSLFVYAGEPCPRAGYWLTHAKHDSRRLFELGEVFPAIPSDVTQGLTLWQWDDVPSGNAAVLTEEQRAAVAVPVEPSHEAESLQLAPRAGLWLQTEHPEVRCRVAEGEPLPLIDGLSVHWQWAEQPPPGMRATSGQPCPYPGIWYCEDLPTGPHAFLHGVPLPQVQGRDVTWFLVRTQ